MHELSQIIISIVQAGTDALSIPEIINLIEKNYCVPLKVRGVCPMMCDRCKAHLGEMLQLSGAHNEAALLTWKARNEMAKAIDEWAAANRGNAPIYDEDFNFSVSGVGNLLMKMFE